MTDVGFIITPQLCLGKGAGWPHFKSPGWVGMGGVKQGSPAGPCASQKGQQGKSRALCTEEWVGAANREVGRGPGTLPPYRSTMTDL